MYLRSKLILLLAVATAAGVLGYNTWLYSCGACTLRALITPSVPGYLLLVLNLALVAVLALLKRRQAQAGLRRICGCGCELLPQWSYCPDCGKGRTL